MAKPLPSRIGIIGGSGMYHIDQIEVLDELHLNTPYGEPSAPLVLAKWHGQEVVFLPRHGSKHEIPPHKINYRANVYAMKLAGVTQLISVSAVGSLRQDMAPGDFVLVDQFVDFTKGRESTFFDGPMVAHVSMADPVCASLGQKLSQAAAQHDINWHQSGNYLAMQGPQFSSRAESELYRSWGLDVIGMTNMPEAKLAREAEICYATIAMCTDYDCWHQHEDDVNVAAILELMQRNVANVKEVLNSFMLACQPMSCACQTSLDAALLAKPAEQDEKALQPIFALVERFL
ncbi:MAG: S-methyl-5'-thioadenosine phosphorylase [Mariprofundaceae bacterium]|nr:S-methyl-5'-thioadenosine phosphorylase [Mariprofundaceae bacterium]